LQTGFRARLAALHRSRAATTPRTAHVAHAPVVLQAKMVYTPQGNSGIDPALTRWPASGAYSLNEWPSAINVGASGPLGTKCTKCPAST
jgi:hypothetical protein